MIDTIDEQIGIAADHNVAFFSEGGRQLEKFLSFGKHLGKTTIVTIK